MSTRRVGEQAAQRRHVAQASGDLRPMSSVTCSAPARLQRRHQPSAGGHHDRAMAGRAPARRRSPASNVRRRRIQRRQQLHDGRAAAHARGAAVSRRARNARRNTGTAPRRRPASIGRYTRGCEFHNAIAGSGQLSGRSARAHFVTLLRVGGRGGDVRGGIGHGGARQRSEGGSLAAGVRGPWLATASGSAGYRGRSGHRWRERVPGRMTCASTHVMSAAAHPLRRRNNTDDTASITAGGIRYASR